MRANDSGSFPPPPLTPEREKNLQALARRLGCRFKDLSLLDRALRHSSYTYEHPEAGPSNEQLEFLGDAVLAVTVSHLLLETFPEASEGELGSAVDSFVLWCFHFDPDAGAYTMQAMAIMKLGGALTLFVLALIVVPVWIRSRKKSRTETAN